VDTCCCFKNTFVIAGSIFSAQTQERLSEVVENGLPRLQHAV